MANPNQDVMQTHVDGLCSLDDDSAITVITSVLQARPELAPAVAAFAVPELTYPPSRSLVDRRATGVLKSYNQENGFGFIQCEELHAVFGCDVFIHRHQWHGVTPGTNVNFAVMLNKDQKPQAYDIQEVDQTGHFVQSSMNSGHGMSNSGHGNSHHGNSHGGAQNPWNRQGASSSSGKNAGKGAAALASAAWNIASQGGAGFSSAGGKGNWQPGSKGAGSRHDGEPIGHQTGTVKSFSEQNGYGFIDCEELKQTYGNDVFMHQRDMGGETFQVGSQVQFDATLGPNGKPQARNITWAGGARGSKRPRTEGWGNNAWNGSGNGSGNGSW